MWEFLGHCGNMRELIGKCGNMWEIMGKCVAIYLVINVVTFFYKSFVAPALGRNVNFRKMGSWAVITGSTDGIGKGYALELAKRGLNVVLISRSIDKLKKVATEIKNLHKVEVKIIAADFTKDDIYDKIEKELGNIEIGTLINNVGMNSLYPDYLHKLDPEIPKNMMMCNVYSTIMMTRIVVPGMMKRKKGVIINVASLSCLSPYIYFALYSSTKAFVQQFSKCMEFELRDKGIIVQCLIPAFIDTNFIRHRHTPSLLMTATPERYVQSSLRTTGIEKISAGYFMHKLLCLSVSYAPSFIAERSFYNRNNKMRLSNPQIKDKKLE